MLNNFIFLIIKQITINPAILSLKDWNLSKIKRELNKEAS